MATKRLRRLRRHVEGRVGQAPCAADTERVEPAPRWDGWGHADTQFEVCSATGEVVVTGKRYGVNFPTSSRELPHFRAFVEERLGVNVEHTSPGRDTPLALPEPQRNALFERALPAHCPVVRTAEARVRHSHGQSCQEIWHLRRGKGLLRPADGVVFPTSHEDVEVIVRAADKAGVCLIPFGGGTSVTGGVTAPPNEARVVVVVSTAKMNKVLWVDTQSMVACIQAGATGTAIEEQLRRRRVVLGHEPDSAEFSTLGGWVATRASGMKKNAYGNIEDIVLACKMVTPGTGTMEFGNGLPRVSEGPSVLHGAVLGCEGTLGIITQCLVRVKPQPERQQFGCIVFPTFEAGVNALREIAHKQCAPASVRLVDHEQFEFGKAMRAHSQHPGRDKWVARVADAVMTWKGMRQDKVVAATLVFEGTAAQVATQQRLVYAIGRRFGGIRAGATAGRRGYMMTFMIAYLRDFGLRYHVAGDSFETCVRWHQLLPMVRQVKAAIAEVAETLGVSRRPWMSCRVTQVYDTGAAVYFYFAILDDGVKDVAAAMTRIQNEARKQILLHGGALSHHHGIGKHRAKWMTPTQVGDTSIAFYKAVKTALDPNNTLGVANLMPAPRAT